MIYYLVGLCVCWSVWSGCGDGKLKWSNILQFLPLKCAKLIVRSRPTHTFCTTIICVYNHQKYHALSFDIQFNASTDISINQHTNTQFNCKFSPITFDHWSMATSNSVWFYYEEMLINICIAMISYFPSISLRAMDNYYRFHHKSHPNNSHNFPEEKKNRLERNWKETKTQLDEKILCSKRFFLFILFQYFVVRTW